MSEESIGEYREGYDAGWNECAKLFKDNGLALGAKDAELATLRKQLANERAKLAIAMDALKVERGSSIVNGPARAARIARVVALIEHLTKEAGHVE